MSLEEKAVALLEHPEQYPGLESWPEHELLIRVWQYEGVGCYSSWLLRKGADAVWVRRIIWERGTVPGLIEPITFGSDAIVSSERATALLEQLKTVVVLPFLQPTRFGIDGVICGVETKSPYLNSRLQWWSTPPESWQSLANWFEETIEYFDSVLPQGSARRT